jgi:hypothetical protein
LELILDRPTQTANKSASFQRLALFENYLMRQPYELLVMFPKAGAGETPFCDEGDLYRNLNSTRTIK